MNPEYRNAMQDGDGIVTKSNEVPEEIMRLLNKKLNDALGDFFHETEHKFFVRSCAHIITQELYEYGKANGSWSSCGPMRPSDTPQPAASGAGAA